MTILLLRLLCLVKYSATKRVVWLLPAPVRAAQMEITGHLLFNMVFCSSLKSAPTAKAVDALY